MNESGNQPGRKGNWTFSSENVVTLRTFTGCRFECLKNLEKSNLKNWKANFKLTINNDKLIVNIKKLTIDNEKLLNSFTRIKQ